VQYYRLERRRTPYACTVVEDRFDGRNTSIPNYEHAIGKEGIIIQVVELIF
jgi:hypothetical protein